ncbi:MAG: TIGR02302 family protein [Pseudomonadota bacterium]
MAYHTDGTNRDATSRRVQRTVLAARWALFWERLWPRVQPALAVVLVFVAASWFGLWTQLPDWARYIGLAFFALAFVGGLLPLRSARWPSDAQARTRVEAKSATAHRPLTAQNDRLANGDASDPIAQALFETHRARMAGQLTGVKAGAPKPRVENWDGWGLRAIPVLLLFVSFFYAAGDHMGRLVDAFVAPVAPAQVTEMRVDAWITPPAYTRRAPLFLSGLDAGAAANIDVPEGSTLLVRVTGTEQLASLSLTDADGTRQIDIAPSRASEADYEDSAARSATGQNQEDDDERLVLTGRTDAVLQVANTEIAQWRIGVTLDLEPKIEWDDVPSTEANGAFNFSYNFEDDYGVRAARTLLDLPEDAQGISENGLYELPGFDLPLSRRNARSGSSKVSKNFTEHPYAGTEVDITLVATDAAGQEGFSDVRSFTLPQRRFNAELARALVSERRKLALDRDHAPRAADMLDALATGPELFFEDQLAAFMSITIASRRLRDARTDDDLRSVVDLLWDTALGIEDGNVSLAAERLREAQENLSQALEDGASDEEIADLMEELRQAMDEFMQAMREQMEGQQPQENFAQNPNAQTLTENDINEMMDRIEELARSGAEDAAREMLNQLQQMMDNLQTAQQGQPQNQGDGQNSEMNEAMDQLAEILQEQQRLRDETFARERELSDAEQQMRQADRNAARQRAQQQQQRQQNGQQQQGQQQQGQQPGDQQNGQQQGQEPGDTLEQQTAREMLERLQEQLAELQQQQGDVQQSLQELMGDLEGMGMQPEEGFGEANEAMGEAGERLGEGQAGSAVGEQGRAMEALRQGAQGMMQQMMDAMAGQQPGPGQPGQQQGQGQPQQQGQGQRNGRDPLGRQRGQEDFGTQNGNFNYDAESEIKRSREIQREIMRRLERRSLPGTEKRYLENLLERD